MKRICLMVALAVLVIAACTGCKATHLLFTTYTKVGLEVTATGGQPSSAVFGYKRFEGAIVPVDPANKDGAAEDVVSLFSAIDVENNWMSGLDVFQIVATGEAAVNAAQQSDVFVNVIAGEIGKGGANENDGGNGDDDDDDGGGDDDGN